jgi:hypothetical protein
MLATKKHQLVYNSAQIELAPIIPKPTTGKKPQRNLGISHYPIAQIPTYNAMQPCKQPYLNLIQSLPVS